MFDEGDSLSIKSVANLWILRLVFLGGGRLINYELFQRDAVGSANLSSGAGIF